MKSVISKSKRPLPKSKRSIRPSMTRDDLSFTAREPNDDYPDHPGIVSWSPPAVPHQLNQWNVGADIGAAMVGELVKFCDIDERETFNAIWCALTSPTWGKSETNGVEHGFANGIAALAIVGLRFLAKGAQPYDQETPQTNPQKSLHWTAQRLIEAQIQEVKEAPEALFELRYGRASGAISTFLNVGLINNDAYQKNFDELRAVEIKRSRAY